MVSSLGNLCVMNLVHELMIPEGGKWPIPSAPSRIPELQWAENHHSQGWIFNLKEMRSALPES